MNNIKRLSSLLVFAEVAKRHSFTIAAKKLNMSKSAVSQHIKRLELDTQQELLTRNTRGMSLTSAGEKLLLRCELLRDQVDLAYDELSQHKEEPSGVFSLTLPYSVEQDIVSPALKQLCIEFPLLTINIKVTDEPLDLIENDLDIAIYAGELQDSDYRALWIGKAYEVLCATPSYNQKNGLLKTPEQLLEHKFIASPWQEGKLFLSNVKTPEKLVTLNISPFAKTSSLSSVLTFTLNGMGIGLLPEFVAHKRLATGDLVRLLPNCNAKQWDFYMVHRFQADKPIHVARFHQLVCYYFKKTCAS